MSEQTKECAKCVVYKDKTLAHKDELLRKVLGILKIIHKSGPVLKIQHAWSVQQLIKEIEEEK